jgi:hypothetical protein
MSAEATPMPEDNSPERAVDILLVLKRDYLTSLFLLSPLALWAAVFIRNIGGHDIRAYLIAAIAGSVLLVGIGLLRLGTIMSLAESGVEVTASINQIIMRRNKGRIEFTYVYNGEREEASMAFRSRDPVKDVQRGTNLNALVDPNKPRRAILPAVFQDENPIFDRKNS